MKTQGYPVSKNPVRAGDGGPNGATMTENTTDAGLLEQILNEASDEQHVSNDIPENDGGGHADSVRELLELVTQKTRFELIQDILAHPKGMPTLRELAHANPSKSKTTIRNHLDKLIEANVIEVVELPEDQRSRDLPYKFYRLTKFGRRFLEEHNLTRSEETLKQMYEMLEKPPRVQKYVDARRPGEEPDEDNKRNPPEVTP